MSSIFPTRTPSLGIITTDCDDVGYSALDEATKKAEVRVVYAKSMYGGTGNASTKLAGEFIGILAGPNPEEVRSGMEAAVSYIENDACFYSANEDDSIVYFAHCISSTGSYLSKGCKIEPSEAIASDCPALRGDQGSGRRAESGGCGIKEIFRSAQRDELRRRSAHQRPGGLQSGL